MGPLLWVKVLFELVPSLTKGSSLGRSYLLRSLLVLPNVPSDVSYKPPVLDYQLVQLLPNAYLIARLLTLEHVLKLRLIRDDDR